jgi:hypothetical protein
MSATTRIAVTLFCGAGLLSMRTTAAPPPEAELGPHQPVSGVYRIYGGGLADPQVPKATDRKIMFQITGGSAEAMFESIGPDRKDACIGAVGERVRWRDRQNLYCSRSPKGEYRCNFGFDLRTGKSIGGIVC